MKDTRTSLFAGGGSPLCPRRRARLALLPLLLCLSSCRLPLAGGGFRAAGALGDGEERLRLVSWNVQTFFDAERDGLEYQDFVTSKGWGQEAYRERLQRLSSSLVELDADVIALEEVENEAVLRDIGNFLCSGWMFGRRYRWAAFCKEPGASLGCAVLSRYPLEDLSCHALDVRSPSPAARPSLRPVMQLRVVKGGRSLVLLVNHWKSMSGGREASEPWRTAQEAVLAACLEALEGRPAVACGDFNRDVRDFAGGDGGLLVLRSGEQGSVAMPGDGGLLVLRSGEQGVAVRSPWFSGDGGLVEPGSYHYKEEWSRIDGFLCAGTAVLEDFRPETGGPWCYEDSRIPRKYTVWNGRGYSDHLPISCTVVF